MSTNHLEHFKLPRWNDLPFVPLYLDQVLSFVDDWLGPYVKRGDKPIMTKTMINNYVKLKFIPTPVKKRYDRLTIALIFIITLLKPLYTIEEIISFCHLALNFSGDETAYNQFCDNLEAAVRHVFLGEDLLRPNDPNDPRWISWTVCNAFACQLYSRKVFLEADAAEGSPQL